MANACDYTMHAKGTPRALDALLRDMRGDTSLSHGAIMGHTEPMPGTPPDEYPRMAPRGGALPPGTVIAGYGDAQTIVRRHMARIWSAERTTLAKHEDGRQTWEISGECAWSALSCMTHDGPGTYGWDANEKKIRPWFIGIEDEALLRGLEIEVHDCEPGMEFATRIIAKRTKAEGDDRATVTLDIQEFDYHELYYEEGYDNIEEMRETYDLTDEEVRILVVGNTVTRTDMDFDTWSV